MFKLLLNLMILAALGLLGYAALLPSVLRQNRQLVLADETTALRRRDREFRQQFLCLVFVDVHRISPKYSCP